MRLLFAFALLCPLAAHAQVGVALTFRDVNGNETAAFNAERRGYDFRVLYDGRINPTFGWRADLAGVQMQYQKEITPGDRTQVSENGIEFSAGLRADVHRGALSGLYGFAAPVASWRLTCGVSGGFVDCDSTSGQRFGYVAGVGYRSQITRNRDLLFELKLLNGVVAGAGSPVLGLGFGMQARRKR
jgi:hypothetical protein